MKQSVECKICGSSFVTFHYKTAKFCSRQCRNKNISRVAGRVVVDGMRLPSGTVGAMVELFVAGDLLKKGYSVFRSLSPTCFCDLIATKNGRVLLVEARTGYMGINGNLSFPQNFTEKIDCFAVYERNSGSISYLDMKKNKMDI